MKIVINRRRERFLKGEDTCRIATVDSVGYPHCVPVGYFYHQETIYIPTVAQTKKARNVKRNPRCCVVVDTFDGGKGKGLMLQGEARLVEGAGFRKLKSTVERLAGWNLDRWEITGKRPDSILALKPKSIVEIGRI